MRRISLCLTLLVSLTLALAPALAQARAGVGGSFGSRGSQTYNAPPATSTTQGGASPIQQSTTMPGSSYAAGYGGYGGYGGGYGRSHFGMGLMGGLLGFGLGSALFGHRGFGGGFFAFHLIFLLIKIAILIFVVRWLFRRFSGRGPLPAGPAMYDAPPVYNTPYAAPRSIPLAGPPVAIQPSDYHAFEALLKNVQAAWSNADLAALRIYATPEMVSYFADQLASNASRGRRNVITDVRLQKGDLAEAWSEGGRTYATVAMRFSMTDCMYDSAGRVVDGSPTEHVTATEYWTFLRVPGGTWMLSAIQQGR
jgi:predicted lipid-binding transport protein (Tim44 family)